MNDDKHILVWLDNGDRFYITRTVNWSDIVELPVAFYGITPKEEGASIFRDDELVAVQKYFKNNLKYETAMFALSNTMPLTVDELWKI